MCLQQEIFLSFFYLLKNYITHIYEKLRQLYIYIYVFT